MPITGHFVADFASFQDAVKNAETSLKGMETGADKVAGSLNRMVDQFSGRKIVQDAELMSQAFEQLATKGIGLTNAELERMGKVAAEAIAKLKAGGEDVPPGIQKIADAAANIRPPVEDAHASAGRFFATLKSAAGLVGIAFSAQAVISFGKHVFSAASEIGDMSEKLGISAEAAQRFKFAAEQSGATLADVGTAVNFMNKALATGDSSTKEALRAVGQEFQSIRNQRPEDAFVAIAEGVKGIRDPMEQARVATELFGRGAAELLPAIKAGIAEVGATTSTMSDETIRDLKAAQDAWSRFGTWVTTVTGTVLATVMKAGPEIKAALAQGMGDPSGRDSGSNAVAAEARAKALEAEMAALVKSGASLSEIWGLLNQGTRLTGKEFDALGREIAKTGGALDLHIMSAEELEAVEKNLALGLRIANDATQAATAAERARSESLKESAGFIVASYQEMVKNLTTYNKANAEAANNMARLGLKVEDFGKTVVVNQDATLAWVNALSKGIPVLADLGLKVDDFGKKVQVHLPEFIVKQEEAAKKAKELRDRMGDLSTALAQLGQVAGGAFGALASGFATLVASANAASTAIANMKKGAAEGFSKAGILDMATGISGIVAAAAAAVNGIKALWSVFDRNKGRDLVVDFAESFGGFDALQLKLEELGDKGAELWIKLTQGVGRNNPEQAQRVIAEVEAALAKQAAAQDEVTGATEEQAQATIETASQAAKALEELGPRLAANEDEWRSWGAVVTAQIQKIADGIRTLPLPSVFPSGSLGSMATSVVQSTSGGTAVIEVDGRIMAQVLVPHLPDEVQHYRLA